MDKLGYRSDIDGLRAVAVMGVLMFHAGFSMFPGGYVGVDVFFVISGYLITHIIRREIEVTGSFSFLDFYARRIRRLFPALVATVLACLILGFLLFTPQYYERLGMSSISAVFSFSNFLFWSQSGYFDAESDLKPLLHTWSLSVEEQFYLFWPLLLLVLVKFVPRGKLVLMFAVGALSLACSIAYLETDPSGAFYITPLRAYEFAIGAFITWVPNRFGNAAKEILLLIGMVMIAVPMLSYDLQTPFPGLAALIPCIGAALCIYAGKARVTGKLLRNPLAVKIGIISYSLYLVHWPIYVFYSNYVLRDISIVEKIGVILFSFFFGFLLYSLVEVRFRRRATDGAGKNNFKVFSSYLAASALLAFPSAVIYASNGFEWRVPEKIREAIANIEEKRIDTWKYVRGPGSPGQQPFNDTEKSNVLVIGDSHAKDYFNVLYLSEEIRESIEPRMLTMDEACIYMFAINKSPQPQERQPEGRCENMVDNFFDDNRVQSADVILYSTQWQSSALQYIDQFIASLRDVTDAELVIMGRAAQFRPVPDLIADFGRLSGADVKLWESRQTDIDDLNEEVQRAAERNGVEYFDKLPLSCNVARQRCDVIDEKGRLLYLDGHHLSLEGAHFMGRKVAESSLLKLLH
ncbi:acyltransferase family protein [Onishia taeanensis]|uniref:acyltransferase family protein n=1 Tax=Onishia taeanensis TaxID=284577 RepID=UPI0015870684|nr:acyltransferase family protein [Halomonas taeanensis]